MKNLILLSALILALFSCRSSRHNQENEAPVRFQIFETNAQGNGNRMELIFEKGPEHNHPLMAVWLEDTNGKYVQTLYVSKSIATSTFNYGEARKGKWMPGVICRPASLPYWAHKRGVKSDNGTYMPSPSKPVPDAYSGATPEADFILKTRPDYLLNGKYLLLFEINQSWDWNDYWTNSKFPDDAEYKTSSQPAIVYRAEINFSDKQDNYTLIPIGHSHYSGKDGKLYTDLSTITTALKIAKSIQLKIIRD